MPPTPVLLVMDGNSLLHRAYHAAATGRVVDRDERPVWAIRGLISALARAAARVRPDAVLVGFDCPISSVRKADYPLYKAHRPEKPADLAAQLAAAPALLREAGVCTVVHPAYEADDVLASSAAHARGHGWRSVLATSDRDAFALIDDSTTVLRVRNGGLDQAVLVTAASLIDVYGVTPGQYRDYAALRGDPSDNLPGVRGFGSATAARLLGAYAGVDAAWAAQDSGDAAAVAAVVGFSASESLRHPEMREAVHRNRRLMHLYADLPMPDLDSARVPIDLLTMRRALQARGIHLGPSLWAITGGTPPPDDVAAPPPQPTLWTRRNLRSRQPGPGQLALF